MQIKQDTRNGNEICYLCITNNGDVDFNFINSLNKHERNKIRNLGNSFLNQIEKNDELLFFYYTTICDKNDNSLTISLEDGRVFYLTHKNDDCYHTKINNSVVNRILKIKKIKDKINKSICFNYIK